MSSTQMCLIAKLLAQVLVYNLVEEGLSLSDLLRKRSQAVGYGLIRTA